MQLLTISVLKPRHKILRTLNQLIWPFILTGAIPTPKNNNPDKKSANDADSKNPDINADNNNPEIPVNCSYFVENDFYCWEL